MGKLLAGIIVGLLLMGAAARAEEPMCLNFVNYSDQLRIGFEQVFDTDRPLYAIKVGEWEATGYKMYGAGGAGMTKSGTAFQIDFTTFNNVATSFNNNHICAIALTMTFDDIRPGSGCTFDPYCAHGSLIVTCTGSWANPPTQTFAASDSFVEIDCAQQFKFPAPSQQQSQVSSQALAASSQASKPDAGSLVAK